MVCGRWAGGVGVRDLPRWEGGGAVGGTGGPGAGCFGELAGPPPRRWTVVAELRDASQVPPAWGGRYAVCPNCRERQPLERRSSDMRCGRCGGLFEVGWNERYLAAG